MPQQPAFTIGRYWLDRVAGSGNWYRFWYDARTGEVRRRSLKTADFEQAKIELAAIILKEGDGKSAEPKDVPLLAVLTRYWEEHADRRRGKRQARQAGALVLDFLGNNARVAALTRRRQIEFIEALHRSGRSVNTIARLMATINAALNRAVACDDEDGNGLLTRAPKIIYQPKAVAAALSVAEPEPRNWHPDAEMIARWLDSLGPESEFLRRWTILMLGFCCRPEAALEAAPFQLDRRYHLIHLNPQGRPQTKKHRPTIPVADALWPLLEEWSTTQTFVGFTGVNYPSKQWRAAADAAGLPTEFIPYALRHFMATELRHAHLRYGVPRVPSDEVEMMMGHRRATTNRAYGVFEPDYLLAAKTAVNAILLHLNSLVTRPIFRQVTAKSAGNVVRESTYKHLKRLTK